jgi:ADP-ribose pyrophosphatase YjhB (NUDIX family)
MGELRVYYKEKAIELTSEELLNKNGEAALEYESGKTMDYALKLLDTKQDVSSVKISYSNTDALLGKIQRHFKFIEAGGGLVVNEAGEILLIFRNDKWDLPKGKLKKGEKEDEGAVREVEEECGVKDVYITGNFKPTYHIYILKDRPVLKKTVWFAMHCLKDQDLKPQLEEGITRVEWFKIENLKEVFENTYPSVKAVLEEYLEKNTL